MLALMLLAGLTLVSLAYLVAKVYHHRFVKYKALPQLPPSFLWGHLKRMHHAIQALPPGEQPESAFANMIAEAGNPPIMLLDVWPAMPFPLLIVGDHTVAEQISSPSKAFPWSMPKTPTLADLEPLLGVHSLLSKQGEDWKALRRRLNPGFAPQHLMTFVPKILDMTDRFLEQLDGFSNTGEIFQLEPLCTNLTFDVIGIVTMDVDFKAQASPGRRNEISNKFLEIQKLDMTRQQLPIWMPTYFVRRRQDKASKRLDTLVRAMAQTKWDEMQNSQSKSARRSVLALSLQGHTTLSERLLSETADSLRTFLFAGHDTTSILLQWAFYELTRSPRALKSLRAELDDVFGPDCSVGAMKTKMTEGAEDVMRRLTYTSAVIKETLRLHPAGGTARLNPGKSPHRYIVRDRNGQDHCIDDCIVYIVHEIVQTDKSVFGPTADVFIPERWIGQTNTWETPQDNAGGEPQQSAPKYPSSAWRAFERGPRNCIGQELANIEARVILAIAARRYDFTKVGLGEFEVDEKGQGILDHNGVYRVKERLYKARAVSSKPIDGMRMRVALSEQARALS